MLKFLGRGSAFNVKEGNTSAYIKSESEMFLFDCGEDVFHKIINNNLLDGISNLTVFISHNNSDHCSSLSSLIFYCFYKKGLKITITTGQENKSNLKNILKLFGNTKQQYFINSIGNIGNRKPIKELFIEKAIEVKHIDGMNCYGLLFKYKDKLTYYSGDSSEIPNEILKIIDKIDYIYQDTCLADYEGNVHLSLRKLCEIIPIEHRHKVWCMHLDCDELIEKAKSEGFNVVEVEQND